MTHECQSSIPTLKNYRDLNGGDTSAIKWRGSTSLRDLELLFTLGGLCSLGSGLIGASKDTEG